MTNDKIFVASLFVLSTSSLVEICVTESTWKNDFTRRRDAGDAFLKKFRARNDQSLRELHRKLVRAIVAVELTL